MTTTRQAPLVFFHVAADRNGQPASLLFDFHLGEGNADAGDLSELIAEETFSSLSGQLPCFYRPGLDGALAEALQQVGWKEMPAGALMQSDTEFNKAAIPPNVAWIVGNWCMAPPAKSVGPQAASRALALQLVQQVAADADTHEIEALLRRDPTLSYHLLRLVNSLGMGTGRKITSFSQAILILGRQQLRRWLNLMLFAAKEGDVRSPMLLSRVAVRARSIELLAKARGLDKTTQEQGFMTGMFSLLGILFGMPLSEVLAPLAISEQVQKALLSHEGDLGQLLQLVESAEGANLAALSSQLGDLQIDAAEFNEVIVEAYKWMIGVVRETKG
jgi:hypothetical protein